jgi:hypothetical protein
MTAAFVPLDITQGEDWTVEIVWTDEYNEPVEVSHPCRMDIKAATGQTFVTLETNPEIPDDAIPGINVSSSMGMLQLHIPRAQTAALLPGEYFYDLFVTTGNVGDYGGTQVIPLIAGTASVRKRYTRM